MLRFVLYVVYLCIRSSKALAVAVAAAIGSLYTAKGGGPALNGNRTYEVAVR
jgi:hypothetical protein